MLYATVRQRKIHVKNPVTVIQNGIGVDQVVLDMDDEWKDMSSIVCVFTLKYKVVEEQEPSTQADADGGETSNPTLVTVTREITREVLHTFGQPIQVPWECLAETGLLSVSCTGYVDSTKVMTTMMPDSFWSVVQNGPVTGDTPMEPTPTLYEQVVAAAGAANTAATQATEIAEKLEADRESGAFDGADGETPEVTIGTVVTGVSGSEAQVTRTGSGADVVLNFVLPRGTQGAPGKDGTPGKDGAPGKDGEPGKPGDKGDPGEPGEKGDKGDKGADGAPGEKGEKGETGEKGEPGAAGADGLTPAIGDNGNWYLGSTDTGKPSRGEKGEPGAKGDPGEKGEPGADGAPGAKGEKGDKGETGATGATGAPGEKGAKGEPGADGYTPVKGTDYWTDEDIAEIKSYVDEAILGGAW